MTDEHGTDMGRVSTRFAIDESKAILQALREWSTDRSLRQGVPTGDLNNACDDMQWLIESLAAERDKAVAERVRAEGMVLAASDDNMALRAEAERLTKELQDIMNAGPGTDGWALRSWAEEALNPQPDSTGDTR
jgi:deoxyribodipyrimidine photolyase